MKEATNFITGSGRCGSTILSKMLMLHPDALVLREFLATMDFRMLDHGEVSGDGLAVLLGGDLHPLNLFLQRGGTMQEVLYTLSAEEMRQPRWSKPGILLGTLPYISDTPDALYEELLSWARQQPTSPLRVHYPNLFKFLSLKTGRSTPIEASAADNIDLEVFPNTRVLHIHRSGPETVLSMVAHPWFRMLASLILDPLSDEELKNSVECSLPEEEDPILLRLGKEDEEFYPLLCKIWSTTIAKNYRVFRNLQPENYLEVAFEDVAANPQRHLREIARFFELPDRGDAWIDAAAELLTTVELRLPQLPEATQKMLRNACYTGQVLTGREPRSWSTASPKSLEVRLFEAHGRDPEPLL